MFGSASGHAVREHKRVCVPLWVLVCGFVWSIVTLLVGCDTLCSPADCGKSWQFCPRACFTPNLSAVSLRRQPQPLREKKGSHTPCSQSTNLRHASCSMLVAARAATVRVLGPTHPMTLSNSTHQQCEAGLIPPPHTHQRSRSGLLGVLCGTLPSSDSTWYAARMCDGSSAPVWPWQAAA